MRNSKKLIAVIMTIAILASMMVPALAASYQTEADKLVAAGLMKGVTATDLALDAKLDRIQGLTFALRAQGVEAAALAMTDAEVDAALATVEDAATIPVWGKKIAAYAVSKNITNGVGGAAAGKIKFAPFAPLTGAQFTTMMLRALGYNYPTLWATCFDKAQEVGMLTASKVVAFGTKAQLTRDDAAYIIYSTVANGKVALAGGVTVGAVKLIDTLVDAKAVTTTAAVAFGYVEPTPAPAPGLTVSSITALNTKQIQVVFNKAVDKTTAETAGNYAVSDKGSTAIDVATAALQADGMTVLLTLKTTAGATIDNLSNATNAKVVVKKAIKDAAGVALAADYTMDTVAVSDSTLPELLTIEATGSKTLKLTFSEPVWDKDDANTAIANLASIFTVKSGIYTYILSSAVFSDSDRTVVLTLGSDMTAGSIAVTVNAGGLANGLVDYAGLNLLTKTFNFTYAPNLSVAGVTVDSVNKATKVIKLKFSKPVYSVDSDTVKVYHSVNGAGDNNGYEALVAANAYDGADKASDTWSFTFTNPVPSGTLNIYLYASKDDNQLKDLFGVKVPSSALSFTVVADTVAPTVSEVKVNTNASFDVVFSEDMDATDYVKAANYEVRKASDNSLVSITTPTIVDAKTVRIATAALMTDNTTYNVTVKAAKDAAGNAMAAASTTAKLVGDNTNPKITSVYGADTKTVYVVFSEDMNASDLVNKSLYRIDADGVGVGTSAALNDDDTITAVSAKKAKITFKNAVTLGTTTLQVAGLRDLAGKLLQGGTVAAPVLTTFEFSDTIANDSALLSKVEQIAKNKLKLTFNKPLSAFDPLEFAVKTTAHAATNGDFGFTSVESNATVDGKQEVVLVLKNDLTTDSKDKGGSLVEIEVNGNAATVNTKTDDGTVIAAARSAAIDKCAPEITKYVFVNTGLIEVQFSETLFADSIALSGKNGFTVTGGTLTKAVKGTGNVILLTSTDADFTSDTDVTYTAGNITDAGVNKVALATKSNTDALTGATIAVVNDPVDNTFTITPNFEDTAIVVGEIDMDSTVANAQATKVINGITYTASVAGGTVTIAATAGTATANAAATTATFTITKLGVVKTVTYGITAVTAGDGFATVTVTVAAQ